jgi:dynein light intermediate chain 1, cytosolic
MLTASQPLSGFPRSSPSSSAFPNTSGRPGSKDSDKQAIWVPMLNAAHKGKDLQEKQLIVLGGTPDQQREFLEQLNPPNLRPRYANNDRRRQPRTAPVSNRYALGYTYHDVLDADQEDVLARLNVYMLANSSASFAPLLRPLLTRKTVKDTLITILLDWSDPLKWARQLRQWIRLLRSVILTLDEQTKIEMEEVMTAWKEKRVGPDAPSAHVGGGSNKDNLEQKTVAPPGPGEWDEGLGIPLSVVCIQAEKIQNLERDYGWGEDQFDFLMQWLRCVLLKHGGSLVYTATFDTNNVRTLVHSSLSIHSLLKREVAKHNIVDRDKILVPPNWDSWGKIRILKEGFDPEAVGDAWSVTIQEPPQAKFDPSQTSDQPDNDTSDSPIILYEATLRHPTQHLPTFQPRTAEETVTVPSIQEFLQTQHEVLEKLKSEDEKAERKSRKGAPAPTGASGSLDLDDPRSGVSNPRMAEHIGPYRTNVNGIDLDPEEATRRIQERELERQHAKQNPLAPTTHPSYPSVSTPMKRITSDQGVDGAQTPPTVNKQSNEAMKDFFANLIKKEKKGVGSQGASPTRAPASERGSPLVRGHSGLEDRRKES